jgi:hypothetical protein
MTSSSKISGLILAGCLMFATSGCLVMDPADEAGSDLADWAEALLDVAAEEADWAEGAGEQDFQVLDGDGEDFPDPFETGDDGVGDDFPDPFEGGDGGGDDFPDPFATGE